MRLALKEPDFYLAITILIAYVAAANRWLDDIAHRTPVDTDRVLALYSMGGMAWEHLDGDTHPPLVPLLAAWKRLRGLS